MKNLSFLSLLCLVVGVQFAASAELANKGKKAPTNAFKADIRRPAPPIQPKPFVQTPLKAKPIAQAPRTLPGTTLAKKQVAMQAQKPALKYAKNDLLDKAKTHFKHKSSSSSSSSDCCSEVGEILDILQTQCIHYIKSVPYEINAPGYYKLACDLVFDPRANGDNAITVHAGVTDVNIDFANYTLSMKSSSTKADNNGILIESDCENIVIHDGSIVRFSASSIRGYTGLNTIVVSDMILEGIPEAGSNRLVVETLASGVNLGAIVQDLAAGPVETPVSNNIKLSNLVIRGFLVDNLTIADQGTWGVSLWYSNDITMDNVLVSQLTSNGLVINSLGNCSGFGLQFCSNSISRFCSARDLTSGSPDSEGAVTGDALGAFYLLGDKVENYDCTYSNNVGTRRGGGLVWVTTNNFVAERCVADSNIVIDATAPGVQSHYGFEAVGIFGPNQNGVVKDCHVMNQPEAFIANGVIDIIFEDCSAIAGNLPGISTLEAEGFESDGSDGITFKNCIATGFTAPNPTTQGGFRIRFQSTNINIIGCKSTKNAIGIFVDTGCTNVVADSNEVAFNTEFGLQDTTATQTPNLYTRNVAFANATNYSVNTANANFKVVQASQAAAYPLYTAANASPLSNFDLQP